MIDNSPDGTAAEAFAARCTLIPNLDYRFEANLGLSNARNVNVALCESSLIAFIDDDALAQPQWLQHLVAAFDEIGPGAAVDHVVHADRLTPEWFRRRVVWQRISEALAETVGPAGKSGPKPASPNANVAAILQTLCHGHPRSRRFSTPSL